MRKSCCFMTTLNRENRDKTEERILLRIYHSIQYHPIRHDPLRGVIKCMYIAKIRICLYDLRHVNIYIHSMFVCAFVLCMFFYMILLGLTQFQQDFGSVRKIFIIVSVVKIKRKHSESSYGPSM